MWLAVAVLAAVASGYAAVEWARAWLWRPSVKPFPAAAPLVPRPLGLRAIPVARIVGSVDRWRELAADFRPPRWRWDKVDDERYRGIEAAA